MDRPQRLLHNHSNWSDGHESLEEIAEQMSGLGLAYWAVTDHSKASFQASGLDEARVEKQLKEIAAVNQKLEDDGNSFRLLSGIEVDVLKGLDFEDDLWRNWKWSSPASTWPAVMRRQHQAPHCRRRKPACPHARPPQRTTAAGARTALNQQAVIDACAETGTWIELNANPTASILTGVIGNTLKRGVKCVINCDAHRAEHAGFLNRHCHRPQRLARQGGCGEHAAVEEAEKGIG